MKRKVDRLDELDPHSIIAGFFILNLVPFNTPRHKKQINFPKVQPKTSGKVCTVEAKIQRKARMGIHFEAVQVRITVSLDGNIWFKSLIFSGPEPEREKRRLFSQAIIETETVPLTF